MKVEGWRKRTTVADLATSELVWWLGDRQSLEAVPVLIKKVQADRQGSSYSIRALGKIGDPRAIPVLMPILKETLDKGWNPSYGTPDVVEAIGDLKATQAVPLLIEHIKQPGVAETLGEIGDPRAIPSLQPIAEAGNVEAMLALHQLGDKSHYPDLYKHFVNTQGNELSRATILRTINDPADPRILTALLRIIREDQSGVMTNAAIYALRQHHSAEAVEGLIDSFDLDVGSKTGLKLAYSAEEYRENIARSLEHLTGQEFGDRPEIWREWWSSQGKKQFTKD